MPIVSGYTHMLRAVDNGTRVRIDGDNVDTLPVSVEVGSSSETWPVGTYIEVVRLPTCAGSVVIVPAFGVTVNFLTTVNGQEVQSLEIGEYARVNMVSPGVWDMHVYSLPASDTAFVFQVGVPSGGHIHTAKMTAQQAQDLIQGTMSSVPVGDPSQPSVVIASQPNSNTPNPTHVHELTVVFDYVNHTFVVTDISNNGSDNHAATVIGDGSSSGGVSLLGDLQDVDDFDYAPNNGDVLTWNSGTLLWEAQPPSGGGGASALGDLTDVDMGFYPPNNGDIIVYEQASNTWKPTSQQSPPYDLKGRPMEMYHDIDPVVAFGSSRHHNSSWRSTSASLVTVAVPLDSAWGFDVWWENNGFPINPGPMPEGGSAVFGKHGAGDVVFAPAPGVTINTPDTLTITRLHGKATLIKVGPNEWDLEGNIGA